MWTQDQGIIVNTKSFAFLARSFRESRQFKRGEEEGFVSRKGRGGRKGGEMKRSYAEVRGRRSGDVRMSGCLTFDG